MQKATYFEANEVVIIERRKNLGKDISELEDLTGKVLGFAGEAKWWVKCRCGNIFKREKGAINKKKCLCRECLIEQAHSKNQKYDFKLGDKFGKIEIVHLFDKDNYACHCDCGNFLKTSKRSIVLNNKQDCGCVRIEKLNKNMAGERFGKLTVLQYSRACNNETLYNCECDCGKLCERDGPTMRNGGVKSCGCLVDERVGRRLDLTNKRFGRLLALTRVKNKNNWSYICLCDCGKECIVTITSLTGGNTRSCGCLRQDTIKEIFKTGGDFQLNKIKQHKNSLINKKYKNLEIIDYEENNLRVEYTYFYCKCLLCYNFARIRGDSLKGNTISCGCLDYKTHEFFDDIIGKKIYRLTVLCLLNGNGYKSTYGCICECGNFCNVPGSGLIKGSSKSCGCLQRETARELGKAQKGKIRVTNRKHQHGEARDKTLVFRINKRIFARDNYTCQKCLEKGGRLNGAHIRNFKDYKPGQYDESNVTTLCVKCHKLYHKTYGNRYLDESHMEEFLGFKISHINNIYDPIYLGV